MMDAFTTTGMTGAPVLMFWLHLHWIAGGAAIIGAILFTVWALRNLQGNALRSLALWLAIGGSIVVLLTAPIAGGAIFLLLGRGTGGPSGGMMNDGAAMQMMDMFREAGDRPGMMDQ